MTRENKKSSKQNKNNVVDRNNIYASKPQYSLEELLTEVSRVDFEGEYDWGEPVGKEIW